AVQQHVSQYPPEFQHGVEHWRAISQGQGKICGVGDAEIFNFVSAGAPGDQPGALLAELLRNRADWQPWGL
ncbi:MAG: hypothetical protein ABR497_07675, partial [Kiritimatiellia bacterium]